MISEIANKEFTETVRDGRFWLTSLIVFVLLVVSCVVGWNYYETNARERSAMQESSYEQWLNQGRRNAHSATHYGIYVFRPLLPLALIDKGTDGYTGTSIFLESHKQNESKLRPAKDIAGVSRFGELTAATVLQMFVPLVIVFVAFSTISKEREEGTLRQTLSLGVSRLTVGIGKFAGIGRVLLCIFLPVVAIGSTFLLTSETQAEFDYLTRGALFVLSYLVYFTIWLLVAIISSAWFSSRVSLIFLLTFWVLAALLVPRGIADASKWLYPTPSVAEFSRAMEQEMLAAENTRNEKLRERVLSQYGVSEVDELPFNFAGLDLQDSEEKGNVIIDRYYRGLSDILNRQDRLHQYVSFLSPTQAIRFVSMGLAGTDTAQNQDFAAAAEAYRRTMVREMNNAVRDNVGEVDDEYRGTQSLSRQTGRDTWAKVAEFHYTVPDAAWVLRNHRLSVTALLGWLIVAVLFSIWSVNRMRVW